MPDYIVLRLEKIPDSGESVTAVLHRETSPDGDAAAKEAARRAGDLTARQGTYAVAPVGAFTVKRVTVRPPEFDVT